MKKNILFSLLILNALTFQSKAQQWAESGALKNVNWHYSFSGTEGTIVSSGTGIEKISTPLSQDFLPKPSSGEVKISTTEETGSGKVSFSLKGTCMTSYLKMVHTSGKGTSPAPAKFIVKDFESQSKVMSVHFNVTPENTSGNHQAIWYVAVGQSGNSSVTGNGSPAITGYSTADNGIYTVLRFRKTTLGGSYSLQARYNDGTQTNASTNWGWQNISGATLTNGTDAKIDLFFNNTGTAQFYTFNGETKELAAAAYHIYINNVQRGTSSAEAARLTRNLAQQNQSVKYTGDLNAFSIMSREAAYSRDAGNNIIYDNSASLAISNFEINHLNTPPTVAQWVDSEFLKNIDWDYSFSGTIDTLNNIAYATGTESISTPATGGFLPKPISGEVKVVTTEETGAGRAAFMLNDGNYAAPSLKMVHTSGKGVLPAPAKFIVKDFKAQSRVMSAHFNIKPENTAENYQAIWYIVVGQSGNSSVTGNGAPAITGYTGADGGIYALLRLRKTTLGGNYSLQARYNDGTQTNASTNWGWQNITGATLTSGSDAKIDLFFNNTDTVQSYSFNGITKTIAATAYHVYINNIQRGTGATEAARLTRNLAQQNQSVKYTGDLSGFSIMSREAAYSKDAGNNTVYNNSASLTVSNFELKHFAATPTAAQWTESGVLKNIDWDYSFSGNIDTLDNTAYATGTESISTPATGGFLPKPISGEVKVVTTEETGIGRAAFILNKGNYAISSLKLVHTSGKGTAPAPAKFIVKDFEDQSKVMSAHFNIKPENTAENYQAIWYFAIGQSGNNAVTGNGSPAITGYTSTDNGIYALFRLRKIALGGNYSLQARYNDGTQTNASTNWGWQNISGVALTNGSDAKIDLFFNNTDSIQSYTFNGTTKTIAAAAYHIYINNVQRGTSTTEAARLTRNLAQQNQSVKYTGNLNAFSIMSREAAYSKDVNNNTVYNNSASLTVSNFEIKHLTEPQTTQNQGSLMVQTDLSTKVNPITGDKMMAEESIFSVFKLADNNLKVLISSTKVTPSEITISDVTGRIIYKTKKTLVEGMNEFELTMPVNSPRSVAIVHIRTASASKSVKLIL